MVLRKGREVPLRLVPEDRRDSDGTTFGQAGFSVVPEFPEDLLSRQDYGIFAALVKGISETWSTSGSVLVSLKKLIFGEISPKNLSGPIGIAKVAADHARDGAWAFVSFLAHLSIVLGVLNLLPIPVLDGGHILYCLIELVKGSPVSEKVQVWGFQIGLAIIIGIMIIAFYNDILRL